MIQHVTPGPRSPRRRSLRAAALALAVVVPVSLTACSSSAEVSESRDSDPRPEATSELDRPSGTDDEPGDSGSNQGGDGRSEFCQRIRDFARDSAGADADDMIALLQELQALAPPQVADDLQAVEDTIEELRSLNEGSGDLESFGRVLDALLDPEMRDALGAIGSYTWDECGVNIEDTWLGDIPGSGS